MEKLAVALIQTALIWEDKKANMAKFDNYFSQLKNDVDLVVLPEMFTTGFTMNVDLAETMDGGCVNWMKTWANKLDAVLVGSMIIHADHKNYNRLIAAFPNGDIQYYDKKHLFSMAKETELYHPGKERKIISIKGFKINLMVCYDLRFPVWSRMTMTRDSFDFDCLIYVANWPKRRAKVWRTLLRARAAENMVFVLGVNRVGADSNALNYLGNTAAIDPLGNDMVQGKDNLEEIIYATLDRTFLEEWREKFPVANDADLFSLG